jgi:hypothetical protein
MKFKCKLLIVLLIAVVLLMMSCWNKTEFISTTSVVKVIDKGHSDDFKELWFKLYDPNNQKVSEGFKTIVKEEKVWNLIEIDKEYLGTYARKKDNSTAYIEGIKLLDQ